MDLLTSVDPVADSKKKTQQTSASKIGTIKKINIQG